MSSEKPERPSNIEVDPLYQVDVGKAEARAQGHKLVGEYDGRIGQEIDELQQVKVAMKREAGQKFGFQEKLASQDAESHARQAEQRRAQRKERTEEADKIIALLARLDSHQPIDDLDREMVRAFYEQQLEESAEHLQEAFAEKSQKLEKLKEKDPAAIDRYFERQATTATLKQEASALLSRSPGEAQELFAAAAALERAQRLSPVGQIEAQYQPVKRRMERKQEILERINKLP